MREKGFSAIVILIGALMVALGIGIIWFRYHIAKTKPQQDEMYTATPSNLPPHVMNPLPPPAQPSPTTPTTSYAPTSSRPEIIDLATSSTEDSSNWKTYINKEYSFQLRYPANWLLTANVAEPDIPYAVLHVDNLVSARQVGSTSYPESQTLPVSVAVYANPNASLSEWLSGVYGKELSKGEAGRIQQALARAYSGDVGTVSFNELRSDNVDKAEVGRVSGGVLFYSGFFAKNKSPYLYVVELRLTFDKSARPADSAYAATFDRMLATFLFTNN